MFRREQHQKQQQQQFPIARGARNQLNGTKKTRFTPAAIRQLMPRVIDEEEECFRHNQLKCSETIELECKNRRWEATYSVPDTDNYDVHVLEAVYKRLVQWLIDEKFDVQPESTRPRSFTVSWDPAQTLASVTEEEKANLQSNAMIRLRTVERARGNHVYFSQKQQRASTASENNTSGYVNNNAIPSQQYIGNRAMPSPVQPVYYMPSVHAAQNSPSFIAQHNSAAAIDYYQQAKLEAPALYNQWLQTANNQAAQIMAEQTWYTPMVHPTSQQQRNQFPSTSTSQPNRSSSPTTLADVVQSVGTANEQSNNASTSIASRTAQQAKPTNGKEENEEQLEQDQIVSATGSTQENTFANSNQSTTTAAEEYLLDNDETDANETDIDNSINTTARKASPFANAI